MSVCGCGGCGCAGAPDASKLLARYECGVCWAVYDPILGDPVWQIEPGTPFELLPAHWTCPNCAAERSKFLELADA
jgi:rubredoxin